MISRTEAERLAYEAAELRHAYGIIIGLARSSVPGPRRRELRRAAIRTDLAFPGPCGEIDRPTPATIAGAVS